LLGLFAGVICDPIIPVPPTPERSLRPYLQRYDGYWIDYEKEIPYPLPPPGSSYQEHYESFEFHSELRGDSDAQLTEVPASMINPYAVGHLVNHPPPDTPPNILLVDFDLPYTFFPTSFARYIPYVKFRQEPKGKATGHANRPQTDSCLRAVAMVAADTIYHGEELYVDYLQD